MNAKPMPTDSTASAAYTRAEAVLEFYARGTGRSGRGADYEEMLAAIIADLAVHCESEAAVAAAEARAEGGCDGGGSSVESICTQGAEIARDLLDAQNNDGRDD